MVSAGGGLHDATRRESDAAQAKESRLLEFIPDGMLLGNVSELQAASVVSLIVCVWRASIHFFTFSTFLNTGTSATKGTKLTRVS